jgi:Rieske Fe-S protein
MAAEEAVVNDLVRAGQYKWHTSPQFGELILLRIRFAGARPQGAVEAEAPGECFVAFSRFCTHLSCSVVPRPPGPTGDLPTEEGKAGLVVCPCHFSSFDLTRQGLVVLGPATDCLPQMLLSRASRPGFIELSGWDRTRSVPYGVPYGETAQ